MSFPLTALAFGTGGTTGLEILAAVPGEVTAKFSGQKVEYIALVFDAKSDIRDVRRVEADPRPRRGQAVVFTSGTPLEPGDYTCRLVIRDMDSGVSAVSSVRAAVRAAPEQGLRLGTPLLLRDETGCAYIDAATGKVLPVAFALVKRNWHPAAEAVSLEFPVAGLAPGRYLLYVTAEDRVSKTLAHVQGALVITED